MSEYNWGDAEESTEVQNNFKRTEIEQVMVSFNIRMKDLTPECQEEVGAFLKGYNDARAESLHDDFVIARMYTMTTNNELPFN